MESTAAFTVSPRKNCKIIYKTVASFGVFRIKNRESNIIAGTFLDTYFLP